MRVCWDAEVDGRAPCGALSSQNSSFLPMSRMITPVPDNVRLRPSRGSAAAVFARDGELQTDGELQRDPGSADEARVAVGRAEIRNVERPLGLATGEGLGRDDAAVADDL